MCAVERLMSFVFCLKSAENMGHWGSVNFCTDANCKATFLNPTCETYIIDNHFPTAYTATAIPFIRVYSFSGNCAASAPISTFLCLWAIYIFPGSVHIFPLAEKADPSWEYIIRTQTHECGNWDPDIPFLGIFVSNFRHFVFAVYDLSLDSSWFMKP